MKIFYIIANTDKDENLKFSREIADYLNEKGASCLIRESEEEQSKTHREFAAGAVDAILVLGGDGTLLRAARELAGRKIPFLGINMGRLGYLAEIERQNVRMALDRLLADDYTVEERMMLAGSVCVGGEAAGQDTALNDVAINRSGELRVVDYDVYVNGLYLTSFTADGVIVSTPTGSTGYSLSAGGPIVSPTASLLLLTPICPHTLNSRSIIFSGEDHIRIQIGEGRMKKGGVCATFDGAASFHLRTGDYVEIGRAAEVTRILKINQVSFLETLRNKLSWN